MESCHHKKDKTNEKEQRGLDRGGREKVLEESEKEGLEENQKNKGH